MVELAEYENLPQTILIIDDDPQFCLLMAEFFSEEGYSVVVAEDGKQGLESLDICQPDIVITDIVMPEMEGVELIKKIREEDKSIPVIAVSGDSSRFSESYLSYARILGANEQVSKPCDLDNLLEIVQKQLA